MEGSAVSDGPYKLPEGWRWVRLGEVCQINPRRPRLARDDGAPTSFVPMHAVDEFLGMIVEMQVRPFAEVRKGYTYFEEGDVLFAKITPCMENGKAAIAKGLIDGIGFGSTEFHVLRPSPEVVAEWVWHFVRQEVFRNRAKEAFRGGVGQQRVPQDFLESQLLPLPPLEEQRRIVAKVEALMARVREARRLRAEAQKDAECLMQAALAEVFPHPGQDLPTGWRWVKLGEVAIQIRSGFAYRKKGVTEGDLLHLRPYNVGTDGTLDLTQKFFIPMSSIREEDILLEPGDVLFNNTNSVELVGKTALVTQPMKAAFSNHITLIRTRREICAGAWLALVMRALWQKGFFAQKCNKWIGQAGYNTKMLEITLIPLPPLDEQRRIVAYLSRVQQQVTALKEAQAETEAELKRLEQAILDKAFRGEL